jgi:hypothetical protein
VQWKEYKSSVKLGLRERLYGRRCDNAATVVSILACKKEEEDQTISIEDL